jgi:hypothetical protein
MSELLGVSIIVVNYNYGRFLSAAWPLARYPDAADMTRFDKQLVQVKRARRIARCEHDDTSNLPVGPAATQTPWAAMSSEATLRPVGMSAVNPAW